MTRAETQGTNIVGQHLPVACNGARHLASMAPAWPGSHCRLCEFAHRTLLHEACRRKTSVIHRSLSHSAGALVQHCQQLGFALQVAQALLKAVGEFESLVDAQGYTALDLAQEADALDVLQLLKTF